MSLLTKYLQFIRSICLHVQKNTVKALQQRWYIIGTWQAVGRSGELATSTYPHFKFLSGFECLHLTQVKTGKMKGCAVFAHRTSLETCAFHGFASYLIATSARATNSNFVHDELICLSNKSAKLNDIFKEYYQDDHIVTIPFGLQAKVVVYLSHIDSCPCSQGIRVGAANILGDKCGFVPSCHRGML